MQYNAKCNFQLFLTKGGNNFLYSFYKSYLFYFVLLGVVPKNMTSTFSYTQLELNCGLFWASLPEDKCLHLKLLPLQTQ